GPTTDHGPATDRADRPHACPPTATPARGRADRGRRGGADRTHRPRLVLTATRPCVDPLPCVDPCPCVDHGGGRGHSSRRRTRRLARPLLSTLVTRTLPTWAVEATWVPPSAWESSPTMSTTR